MTEMQIDLKRDRGCRRQWVFEKTENLNFVHVVKSDMFDILVWLWDGSDVKFDLSVKIYSCIVSKSRLNQNEKTILQEYMLGHD